MYIIQLLPVLRLLLPFLCGIIIYLNFPINFKWVVYALPFLCGLFLVFSGRLNSKWKLRWVGGILLNAILVLSGIGLTHSKNPSQSHEHFMHDSIPEGTIALACIDDQPKIAAKSYKVTLDIKKIRKKNKTEKTVCGKLQAYLSKEIQLDDLEPGKWILIRLHPSEIPEPGNPGEFNYKRYLSFHGVFHQQYFKKEDLLFPDISPTEKFQSTAWKIRKNVLKVLREITHNDEDFGVIAALVTGYEEDLSPDTIRAYSATGALHVLSVSGMHVGIIFLLIDLLLKHLEKIKHGKIIRLMLSLGILWFYALFTGLSPSVLRACTMFTFLQTGKYFQKNPNSLNTLLSSGFVLLLINPYLATEVGFQLSFFAVGGIIIFYRRIHGLLQPTNWMLKQAWSITAVSIAAQLSTFPMGLLYFHQFPNYFLLSNLIIIPLTTIILYGGMFFILVSPILVLKTLTGNLCDFLLVLLRKIVVAFERLPYAQLTGVDFSIAETFTTYSLIAFASFFCIQKKPVHLLLALFSFLILSGLETQKLIQQKSAAMLVVYKTGNNNTLGIINNQKLILLSEREFLNNENGQRFHCSNHWFKCGIKDSVLFDLSTENISEPHHGFEKSGNIIRYQNKTILINPDFSRYDPTIEIDLILLTNKHLSTPSLKTMATNLPKSVFIVGGSIPSSLAKKWKIVFDAAGVNSHSVQLQGFFAENLK